VRAAELSKRLGKSLPETIKYLQEEVPWKEFVKFKKEMGYGAPSKGELMAVVRHATGQEEKIPRMMYLGKKVGAYTLNSLGDHRYNTIDRWEGRYIKSYFKGLLEREGGQAMNIDETKLAEDFIGEFNRIWRDRHGPTSSSALQAVRWYFIKKIVKDAGYERQIFDETISEYAKKHFDEGIDLRSGKLGAEESAAQPSPLKEKADIHARAAKQALLDIKDEWGKTFRLGIRPNPPRLTFMIERAVVYGTHKLSEGALNLADFTKVMVKDLGEWVKPHIQDIYNRAQGNYASWQQGRAERKTARMKTEIEQRKAGTYEPRPKYAPIELNKEQAAVERELEDLRYRHRQAMSEQAYRETPVLQRLGDHMINVMKAGMLTSKDIYGKLGTAGVGRIGSEIMEQTAGAIAHVFPGVRKLSRLAPAEGSPFVGMGRGLLEAGKAIKDIPGTIIGRGEETEMAADKYGASAQQYRPKWYRYTLGVPAQSHAATKLPFKRGLAEMTRAKIARAGKRSNYFDMSEAGFEKWAEEYAKEAGRRGILMGHNPVSDFVASALSKAYAKGPGGRFTARLGRVLFPFVRIPTNIIREVHQMNLTGTVQLGAHMVKAMRNGLESMPIEERDLMMRLVKKQMVGAALAWYAWNHPNDFGGLDYKDEKGEKKRGLKEGQSRWFGVKVPSIAAHFPLMLHMQMWATMRHYVDKGESKVTAGPRAFMLLLKESPFLGETVRVTDAMSSAKAMRKYMGQFISGRVTPAITRQIAVMTDKAEKRYPVTIPDYIKQNWPGFRQSVPATKGQAKAKERRLKLYQTH
jgi:hypothetical protein